MVETFLSKVDEDLKKQLIEVIEKRDYESFMRLFESQKTALSKLNCIEGTRIKSFDTSELNSFVILQFLQTKVPLSEAEIETIPLDSFIWATEEDGNEIKKLWIESIPTKDFNKILNAFDELGIGLMSSWEKAIKLLFTCFKDE